jgi:hypothetical protein
MVALGARFLLELCMLAALAYWGFEEHGVAAGIGAPLLAALAWGLFVSPKAPIAPGPLVVLLIELALFGAAVAGLALADHALLGLLLGIGYALDRAVLAIRSGSLEIEQ